MMQTPFPFRRLNPLHLKQQYSIKSATLIDLLGDDVLHENHHNIAAIRTQHLPSSDRQPLKIMMVSETWLPEINGVAHSMSYLCQGLKQRGHEIALIRPVPVEGVREQNLAFIPHTTFYVRGQKIPNYPALRFGWPECRTIQNALEAFRPDIVHIVTEGPLGLAALYTARQMGLPISSAFHSSFHEFSRFFQLKFLFKPLQQYLRWFHNATQVTCVPSTYTMQELITFGVHNHIHVVGHGIDVDRFSPTFRDITLRQTWGADAETTVLLYVGRLSPEKQIDQVILGYQMLKLQQPERKVKLVLVGEGPEGERLKHLDPDIIMTGALRGEALSKAYASADVFAFASLTETFGNVVLEAMASGLAVIAFNYACAAQFIQHKYSGYLIQREQPQQFLEQLGHLPEQTELAQMGENAYRSIQYNGWDLAVQQFESALYQAKYLQHTYHPKMA